MMAGFDVALGCCMTCSFRISISSKMCWVSSVLLINSICSSSLRFIWRFGITAPYEFYVRSSLSSPGPPSTPSACPAPSPGWPPAPPSASASRPSPPPFRGLWGDLWGSNLGGEVSSFAMLFIKLLMKAASPPNYPLKKAPWIMTMIMMMKIMR